MFGNTLGWLVSAVIAAIAAFAAFSLIAAGIPTPATGFAETLKPLTLATAAEPVLPKVTNTHGNAGDLYRHAIDSFKGHERDYDVLQHNQDYPKAKADAARLGGVNDLVQASKSQFIGIFADKPESIINFDAHPEGLEALGTIANTAGMMAELAKVEGDNTAARDYASAVLVLGVRLYQERLAYLELEKGESLISAGIRAWSDVADVAHPPATEIAAHDAFKAAYATESAMIQPIAKVFFNIGDAGIARHAGDMFQIAIDPQIDRVWRVEAIHRVGRLRYNADVKADQLKAPRILGLLANDPKEDAIIHLAADLARNMTASENQSQR